MCAGCPDFYATCYQHPEMPRGFAYFYLGDKLCEHLQAYYHHDTAGLWIEEEDESSWGKTAN